MTIHYNLAAPVMAVIAYYRAEDWLLVAMFLSLGLVIERKKK